MSKISDWKLAKKLQASNRCGIITGIVIAVIVIAIVVVAILKLRWIKKHFGCMECEVDMFEDDFDIDFDEDEIDESDFV